MRFHWQNLNEKPGNKLGHSLKHFRFWVGDFGGEWLAFSKKFSLRFSIGGHHGVGFSLSLFLFTVYLSYDRYVSWLRVVPHGEFAIYWYMKGLWFALWQKEMESNSADPWWRKIHVVHFDDVLLGRAKYSTEVVEVREVLIPMPEGSYPAIVNMELARWKRPRWFATEILRANVEIPNGGIPHEGKGENSWDIGEDACLALSCVARNVEDATAKVVESVLRDRHRYGTPSRIKPVLAVKMKGNSQ